MSKNEKAQHHVPKGLRIGGVARLTGLTESTIRAWERRHKAITPQRTSAGYRVYDAETVERLQWLQLMRQRGAPLASLATCSTQELRERAMRSGPNGGGQAMPLQTRSVQLALLHPTLGKTIGQYRGTDLPFSVIWAGREPADINGALPAATDIFVAKLDLLGDAPLTTLGRLVPREQACQVVIETGFTRRHVVESLRACGMRTVQGPLTVAELATITRQTLFTRKDERPPKNTDEAPPAPIFTLQELSAVREATTSIACECPRHLAALIIQLNEFERYSQTCSDDEPEEAALHQFLTRETGRVRAQVENMLQRVGEMSGVNFQK